MKKYQGISAFVIACALVGCGNKSGDSPSGSGAGATNPGSLPAVLSGCQLDSPVAIPSDTSSGQFDYLHATTQQPVIFNHGSSDGTVTPLGVSIFEIKYGRQATGSTGVSIHQNSDRSSDDVGFAGDYEGNFDISSDSNNAGDNHVIHTIDKQSYGNTESWILIDADSKNILSVKLSYPVTVDGKTTQQTVCVKSMKP